MDITIDVDTTAFDDFIREALDAVGDPKMKRGVVRANALDFIGRVVPRTPVDTGRARGGWTAMRGSTRAAGVRLGPGAAEGRRVSSYREDMRGDDVGAEIFNGVSYIAYLELGSSQQAPAGFVRLTLREMSGQAAKEGERRTEAALRLANIKARRRAAVRQGIGRRPGSGRYNIGRR